MSSVRLQIDKKYSKDAEVYREDENGIMQLIAQQSRVSIRKTRFSKGLRESIAVPIYFAAFFPNPEEVAFDLGRQTQVIKVREGTFSYKYGSTKVEADGRKAFIEKIVSDKLLSALIADIKEEASDKGIVLPPELLTYEVVSDAEVTKKEAKQSAESAAVEEFLTDQAKKDETEESNEVDVSRTSKKGSRKVRAADSLE